MAETDLASLPAEPRASGCCVDLQGRMGSSADTSLGSHRWPVTPHIQHFLTSQGFARTHKQILSLFESETSGSGKAVLHVSWFEPLLDTPAFRMGHLFPFIAAPFGSPEMYIKAKEIRLV